MPDTRLSLKEKEALALELELGGDPLPTDVPNAATSGLVSAPYVPQKNHFLDALGIEHMLWDVGDAATAFNESPLGFSESIIDPTPHIKRAIDEFSSPIDTLANSPAAQGLAHAYNDPRDAALKTGLAASNFFPVVGPAAYLTAVDAFNSDIDYSGYEVGEASRRSLIDFLLGNTAGGVVGGIRGVGRGLGARAANTAATQAPEVQDALGYLQRRGELLQPAEQVKRLQHTGNPLKPGTADKVRDTFAAANNPVRRLERITDELALTSSPDDPLIDQVRQSIPELTRPRPNNPFTQRVDEGILQDSDAFEDLAFRVENRKNTILGEKDALAEAVEIAASTRRAGRNQQNFGKLGTTRTKSIGEAFERLDSEVQSLGLTPSAEVAKEIKLRTGVDYRSLLRNQGGVTVPEAAEMIRGINLVRRHYLQEFDRRFQAGGVSPGLGAKGLMDALGGVQHALVDGIRETVRKVNNTTTAKFPETFFDDFSREYSALTVAEEAVDRLRNKSIAARGAAFSRTAGPEVSGVNASQPGSYVSIGTGGRLAAGAGNLLRSARDYVNPPTSRSFVQSRFAEAIPESALQNVQTLLNLEGKTLPSGIPDQTFMQRLKGGLSNAGRSGAVAGLGSAVGGSLAFNQLGASGPSLPDLLVPQAQAQTLPLPRNSAMLAQNPQLLMQRLSQLPGVTSFELEDVQALFNPAMNARQRSQALAQFAQNRPELFEPAEFTSLMDGVIYDPDELSLAREQVTDDLKLGRIDQVEAARKHTALSRRTNNTEIPLSRRSEPPVLATGGLNTSSY